MLFRSNLTLGDLELELDWDNAAVLRTSMSRRTQARTSTQTQTQQGTTEIY